MSVRNVTSNWNHLVTLSPWPVLVSIMLMNIAIGLVLQLQFYLKGEWIIKSGLLMGTLIVILWWRDIRRESYYIGDHTKGVVRGLKWGMVLFIVSEVIFFIGFFWAFFHSSLSPSIELGNIWEGLEGIDNKEVRLLNTIILLLSGGIITMAHHRIKGHDQGRIWLELVILCGILFIILQYIEYKNGQVSISDGVYGSTLYILTGLHGLHIIIGTIYIIIGRMRLKELTNEHHVVLETGIWYWHFVDVVWLFLYVIVYCWGSPVDERHQKEWIENVTTNINMNSPEPYKKLFQDPGSLELREMINLHDNIMYYLIIILIVVTWLIIKGVILESPKKSSTKISKKYLRHGTNLEIIWTILPGIILILIAIPSFKLLYLIDEIGNVEMTIKVIGKQWYWTYEYSDYEIEPFDSYMIPTTDLTKGQLRLLEVDERLILPTHKKIRFIITGGDVIHSFSIPALGIKMDAIPGRLNSISTIIEKEGIYYGNCSELCGTNHYGMPIVIEAKEVDKFISSIA